MFQEEEIKSNKTLSSGESTERSTNSLILSMLMNIQMSQRRESLMKCSDFMLRDHSILSHNCQHIDTLISLITEEWQSRLLMEETVKSGTSINNP
jgi:hypothetical protein